MTKLFLIFLLVFKSVLASPLINDKYLGQWPERPYYGPFTPQEQIDFRDGKIKNLDEQESEHYLYSLFNLRLLTLEKYLLSEYLRGSICYPTELAQSFQYLRYLFRLINLSYLYESLNRYRVAVLSLDSKSKFCEIPWEKEITTCTPQYEEMKKFIFRAVSHVKKNPPLRNSKKDVFAHSDDWPEKIKLIQDGKRSLELEQDPAVIRVFNELVSQGKSTQKVSGSEILSILENSCTEDLARFKNICDEQDELYGASFFRPFLGLLEQSNAFFAINRQGKGLGCLKRFQMDFSHKEVGLNELTPIFRAVFSQLSHKQFGRYQEGDLFLPGSLKMFDDLGLQNFLFSNEAPTPIPTAIPTIIPAVTKKNKIPMATPTVKAIRSIVPVPVVREIVLSAFESALSKLKSSVNVMEADLDMIKLKQEFVFGPRKKEIVRNLLKDFQTREGLQDMKNLDKLGSENEPMRLLFLKFLIEDNQHQGLYNIQNIIGKKFFLVNDLENKKEVIPAKLLGPDENNNAWGIRLLKSLVTPVNKVLVEKPKKEKLKKKKHRIKGRTRLKFKKAPDKRTPAPSGSDQ